MECCLYTHNVRNRQILDIQGTQPKLIIVFFNLFMIFYFQNPMAVIAEFHYQTGESSSWLCNVKRAVIWYVTPLSVVDLFRHSGITCAFHVYDILPWRWKQHLPQVLCYLSTSLCGIISQKTAIFIVIAIRTISLFTCRPTHSYNYLCHQSYHCYYD